MWNLEDRGPMMIEPGWKVYQGMIVGQHTRDNDLEVNVMKGKKLTNIRTHSKDEAVRLKPSIQMTLEKALAYIQDDELVEVTPKSIRLRKALLRPERPQADRAIEGGRRRCVRRRRREHFEQSQVDPGSVRLFLRVSGMSSSACLSWLFGRIT